MGRRFLHYIPGPKDLDSSPWSMRLEEGTGSSRKGDRRMPGKKENQEEEVGDLLPDGVGICPSPVEEDGPTCPIGRQMTAAQEADCAGGVVIASR